jgi:hypothetical protein
MIYALVVILTMFALPSACVAVELLSGHGSVIWLIGKWFVFWAVGARLLLAGLRQYFQPGFTSRDILGIESPDAFVLVRELGGANVAAGIVGLASFVVPTFVLPAAIGAAIFYAVAGVEHARQEHRGGKESLAMVSDLFVAAILALFVLAELAGGAVAF